MKLPSGPYTITLSGDIDAFVKSPANRANLHYLLERLFNGDEIAERELEAWGIRIVEVRDDAD